MSLDLAILGAPADPVADLRIDNLANDGIYKLVQKVLIILFTDSSVSTNLGIGTSLSSETISANSRAEFVNNIFNIALDKVKDDLELTYPADAPDEEKLASYRVQATTTTDKGTVAVDLTIESLAGESVTVNVPIDHISAE
jgi:hypothetical protein